MKVERESLVLLNLLASLSAGGDDIFSDTMQKNTDDLF